MCIGSRYGYGKRRRRPWLIPFCGLGGKSSSRRCRPAESLTIAIARLRTSAMRSLRQRLFASFTAVVILVTSVNCWCGASQAVDDACCRQGSQTRSCCSGDDDCGQPDADHCPGHNGKEPHHCCQHCQGTLVSESSAAQHLSTPFDYCVLHASLGTPNLQSRAIVQLQSSHHFTDPPPLCGPPTLLRLHCALTI